MHIKVPARLSNHLTRFSDSFDGFLNRGAARPLGVVTVLAIPPLVIGWIFGSLSNGFGAAYAGMLTGLVIHPVVFPKSRLITRAVMQSVVGLGLACGMAFGSHFQPRQTIPSSASSTLVEKSPDGKYSFDCRRPELKGATLTLQNGSTVSVCPK